MAACDRSLWLVILASASLCSAACHLSVGSSGEEPGLESSPSGATATSDACKALPCAADEVCTPSGGGALCIPRTDDPCLSMDCPSGTSCSVLSGAAVCSGGREPSEAGVTPVAARDAGASDAALPVHQDAGAADAGQLDASEPRSTDGSTTAPDAHADASDGAPQPTEDASPPEPVTCATKTCPTGTYCDEVSGIPHCIKNPSCEPKTCSAGTHCELIEVQCMRVPCPPLPICIADPVPTDPCAEVRCKAGTHCEVTACIASPCAPECVPDAPAGSCGGRECGAGTYCCNASCGICSPKKGVCPQVICEPGPLTQ